MRLEGLSLFKCRVLVAVVELGGFHNAARHLSMTQPAVSRHIRDFDLACGAPLFKRQGRKSTLTEAGQAVYRFALQVMAGSREMHASLNELILGERGRATVGVTPNWGNYFLPDVLERFAQICPNVALEIETGQTQTLYIKTLNGTLDFAVGVVHNLPDGLERQLLHSEELVLVVSAKTSEQEIPAHINGEKFGQLPFMTASSPVFHAVVLEELQRWGLPRPQVHMPPSSLEIIKQFVARGLGVSLLCRRRVAEDLAAGRMREIRFIGDPVLRCQYGLIYRQSLTPVARNLMQAIFDSIDENPSDNELVG